MSRDELMAVVERVRSDTELQARFAQVGDADGVVALLEELGVQATIEDVKQAVADMPLSEEELGDVAGGFSNGPFNNWLQDGFHQAWQDHDQNR